MRLSLLIAALVLGIVGGVVLVRDCESIGLVVCVSHLTLERATTYATLVLALVALILTHATWRSAEAAKQSAAILPQLERAYLFETATMTAAFGDTAMRVELGETPALCYTVTLTNYGRTPAIVRRLACGADHSPPMPAESAYPRLEVGPELILRPGEQHVVELRDPQPADAELVAEVHRGNVFPKLFGRVDYDDMFGQPHVTAWHWAYNGKDDTFAPFPWKGRRANYRR
ncbi:MAG: hypothetical protein J0H44_15220 [Alphaproteobacteria bacterium]|nr:hypothetical protein [Alphaproteobacteria bacterium]